MFISIRLGEMLPDKYALQTPLETQDLHITWVFGDWGGVSLKLSFFGKEAKKKACFVTEILKSLTYFKAQARLILFPVISLHCFYRNAFLPRAIVQQTLLMMTK